MPDAGFEQQSANDGPASHKIDFLAEVGAVTRVDAVTLAAPRRCSRRVPRNACDIVPIVICRFEVLLVQIKR